VSGRPSPGNRPDRRPLGHPGLVPDRPRRGKVDCIDLVEEVTAYLDDAVPATERERIDRHLETCADCTRVLAQWRTVIALSGHLGAEAVAEIDPATREQLLAAFRTEPR
jgi:Putative zinc-finger